MLGISEKELTLLEVLCFVVDEREYHPFVFSHDKIYSHSKFYEANQIYLELVYFLGLIGVNIESNKTTYADIVNRLLLSITSLEENQKLWYYEIKGIDYSLFNVLTIPNNDYSLIRLFIALRNGAALDKVAICRILNKELSSNDITQLKKLFMKKTTYVLVTNSDNSYALRKGNNELIR